MGSRLKELRPGQRVVMQTFARHGLDSVYVPSDFGDLRVCTALRERGLLAWYADADVSGYELTPAGRAALSTPGEEG